MDVHAHFIFIQLLLIYPVGLIQLLLMQDIYFKRDELQILVDCRAYRYCSLDDSCIGYFSRVTPGRTIEHCCTAVS